MARSIAAVLATILLAHVLPASAQTVRDILPGASGSVAREAAPAPAPQGAGAGVRVRVGDHPDFGRMVFDWTQAVQVSVVPRGDAVEVRFDRPAQANLGAVGRGFRNVTGAAVVATEPALVVRVSVKPGVTARMLRDGTKVAVDFLDPPKDQAPGSPVPSAPPAAPPPPPGAPIPPSAVLSSPAAAGPPGGGPAGAAAPVPAAPAAKAEDALSDPIPDRPRLASGVPVPPRKPGTPVAAATTAPPAAGGSAASAPVPSSAAAAPAGASAATKPSSPAPTPAPAQAPAATTGPAVAGPVAKPLEPSPPSPPERPLAAAVVFDAAAPVAAAVFQRSGYLFAVFDRPLPITAGRVVDDPGRLFGAIEPVPAVGGTAFRVALQPWLRPSVVRDGAGWRILAVPAGSDTEVRVPAIEPQPDFSIAPRLVVRAEDADAVIEVRDPDAGDSLFVVPLPAAPEAVPAVQDYPQLSFLPALQGIVVQPKADGLTMRPVREGVEITSAGGLRLSPGADIQQARASAAASYPGQGDEPPAAAGRRLVDFKAWQRGPRPEVNQHRQALQSAIVDVPADGRNRARLDLARFYLAHGYGQEARGLLAIVGKNDPDLEVWPEFRILRGIARLAAGDGAGADTDLAMPEVQKSPDGQLWRSYLAAQRRDWPAAAAGFKTAAGVLGDYPEPWLERLGFAAADAFLETGRTADAAGVLDRVVTGGNPGLADGPAHSYLRGRVLADQGKPDEALPLLEKAANGPDRLYRARGGLALINLQLANDRITPAVGAERLAALGFAWRGDVLERDIVRRYGEVLWQAEKYADSLNTLRRAASMMPKDPKTPDIAKTMVDNFGELFKDGAAKLPPLEALTLYDQFRELTPVGAAGDEVIRQLAERLVEVDLLARAGDLLQHQVEYRLAGADKAKVGTRLAAIRLLDGKADQALTALKESEVADGPADLGDTRRVLRARALTDLGRTEEALSTLAGTETKPADMLRVDIAWRSRNWRAAAEALGRVIGAPPKTGGLPPDTASLVVDRAVALALAADLPALDKLRKDFGGAMTGSPLAAAFSVLTRADQPIGPLDIETIKQRVAEVDVFQNFLKGVRDNGKTAPRNPNVPAPPGGA